MPTGARSKGDGWLPPTRSDHGARLKNSHHTKTANPPAIPPRIAVPPAPGTTMGRTYLASHCSATAATPGHSRSGFRGVEPVSGVVMGG